MKVKRVTGQELHAALRGWQLALGLEDWAYTLHVGPMPKDEWGEAGVDVPYKKVRFRCYPKRMAEEGEDAEEYATHEWAHRWTEEICAFAEGLCRSDKDRARVEALEEQMATDLGRVFLRLHHRPRGDR